MDQAILSNATSWAENSYFEEQDRNEIKSLLSDIQKNEVELNERFYRDLEFGTGGLRAPMGMGSNRMNKYNVRRATQALANMMTKSGASGCAVVSYDSRNNSFSFAKEVAGVFAANGIKAYIFNAITPTPILSFAVRTYKALGGVMITASHNPPIYNGFKAFWNDGAQVVPPVDKQIIEAYNGLTDWNEIKSMSFEEGLKTSMIEWVNNEVVEAYYKVVEDKVIQNKAMCLEDGHKLSIVYTNLHGTGEVFCQAVTRRLGFTNFYSIPEQAQADGNFPTVKSPNPEDAEALQMAVDYMLKHNADIAYGTDPDGDRLGVVVNNKGTPAYINGNQIAALMIYYVMKYKSENKTMPNKPLIIKSIVTSPIQNAIAEHFGGTVLDTLTGFKWMAGLIRELELQNSDYSFVFASEESFGYMPHAEGRDKDGVSSLALMSEVALYFKNQGMNLVEALDEIYEEFGFFYESLVSLTYEGISGTQKISRIMEFFRKYPEPVFAREEIVETEDYLTQQRTNLLTKEISKIEMTKSNVLSFTFKSGNKLFLRPSGTEPKIKFYTMVRETEGDLKTKKENALKRVQIIESEIRALCEKI
ncbi:MAG TPA: phospho-sugar mutase [Bacteriovoracaceae bacterium]|nr:phospho-sugar mutase [Bacteriovoracaceae bacterium]